MSHLCFLSYPLPPFPNFLPSFLSLDGLPLSLLPNPQADAHLPLLHRYLVNTLSFFSLLHIAPILPWSEYQKCPKEVYLGLLLVFQKAISANQLLQLARVLLVPPGGFHVYDYSCFNFSLFPYNMTSSLSSLVLTFFSSESQRGAKVLPGSFIFFQLNFSPFFHRPHRERLADRLLSPSNGCFPIGLLSLEKPAVGIT